ncbi:MAG: protein translocase subunit SecF [Firmicutes bacterium]|nr:protein translocase subunit SecF [Bacillota bacterium]
MRERNKRGLNYKIEHSKFNPYKISKWFMLAAGVILTAGAAVLIFAGFNLGMDFTGGTVLTVTVGNELEDNPAKYGEVRQQIETVLARPEFGLSISRDQMQDTGSKAAVTVQFQDKPGLTESDMEVLNSQIVLALGEVFPGYDVRFEFKGATTTSELIMNALYAILLASLLITIYIAIRFEFFSGLAAIVAQLHDVLMLCAFVLIFQMEINSAFIAALITVLGYSINNTIILFDRIRDNRRKESMAKLSSVEIVNISIKQTLVRSINTSISTLLAILMLAIIGVPSIREFAIPLAIGLLVGTYSSMFIASPIWVKMVDSKRGQEYFKRKAIRAEEREKAKEELKAEQQIVRDAEYEKAK